MLRFKELVNNNILMSGETGAGKSYILHKIIEEIRKEDEETLIYISDPKFVEFKKDINNQNILSYDALEIAKIIKERQNAIKNDKNISFNHLFIIYDEIGLLLPPSCSIAKSSMRKEAIEDSIIKSCNGKAFKDINVHLIAATQTPARFTLEETFDKFDLYFEIKTNLDEDNDYYLKMLKKKFGKNIYELCTTHLDERFIIIYKLEK